MRRRFDDLPQKGSYPSRNFFVNIFKRKYAEVVVDTKRRDIYLILRLKRDEQYHSVRKFCGNPAKVEFPKWARKACVELFFHYFS